jgi:predicted small lipoprotein YifL
MLKHFIPTLLVIVLAGCIEPQPRERPDSRVNVDTEQRATTDQDAEQTEAVKPLSQLDTLRIDTTIIGE